MCCKFSESYLLHFLSLNTCLLSAHSISFQMSMYFTSAKLESMLKNKGPLMIKNKILGDRKVENLKKL